MAVVIGWLRIIVRHATLLRAIAALLSSSTARHEEARREKEERRAAELRHEGDADAMAHNELWQTLHGGAIVRNESVSNNTAPVQQMRVDLPGTVTAVVPGWLWGVIGVSALLNVVLGAMYLNSQRTVADAYKDIKTQVWVRQDKDEERFQKFVAGPYADLAGQVRANQILFSKCNK